MEHINRIEVAGVVSDAPILRHTQSGKSVCNINVYTETVGGKCKEWHKCVGWEGLAEGLSAYPQGSFIKLVGSKNSRSYTSRDGQKKYVTEINVTEIKQPQQMPQQQAQAPPQANQYQQTQPYTPPQQVQPRPAQNQYPENDIPF